MATKKKLECRKNRKDFIFAPYRKILGGRDLVSYKPPLIQTGRLTKMFIQGIGSVLDIAGSSGSGVFIREVPGPEQDAANLHTDGLVATYKCVGLHKDSGQVDALKLIMNNACGYVTVNAINSQPVDDVVNISGQQFFVI